MNKEFKNEKEKLRQELLELNDKRMSIDEILIELYSILRTQNVNMKEPLIDSEGYPRSDIDVYKIRHTRRKIIELQNDVKDLLKIIETKLYEYNEK